MAQRPLSIEIRNPDTPALSIADASAFEGDSGTKTLTFAVSLSRASAQTVSVHYATANGTATAGSDYGAASGTLSFAPGALLRTVAVTVNGDATVEPSETFVVNLDTATNAVIADAQGQGTILDDDAPPTLSINDVSVSEGDSGTVNTVFTVSLSRPLAVGVTVTYATADGTASAGSDYVAAGGILTFLPGDHVAAHHPHRERRHRGRARRDLLREPQRRRQRRDRRRPGAGHDRGRGRHPHPLGGGPTATEGQPTVVFLVTLSTPIAETVEVGYHTVAGTATSPGDYKHTSGTLVFAPGTAVRTVPVTLVNDAVDEPVETFSLELSDPVGATIADGHAEATILDDDLRTLSVADVEVTEGDAGTTNATFTLSLSGPASVPIAVDYQTEDGTASAGTDYVATSGTATFPVGTTSVERGGSGQRRHRPRTGRRLHLEAAQPAEREPRGDRPGPLLDARHGGGRASLRLHGRRRLRRGDGPADRVRQRAGSIVRVLADATGAAGPPTWTTVPTTGAAPALGLELRPSMTG